MSGVSAAQLTLRYCALGLSGRSGAVQLSKDPFSATFAACSKVITRDLSPLDEWERDIKEVVQGVSGNFDEHTKSDWIRTWDMVQLFTIRGETKDISAEYVWCKTVKIYVFVFLS
ncbi:hypothetical protein JI721_12000 [Alicyclobacillus cycloheptanicus]|uniref:Uncharacterized protein n=1 Tax=Alicyclobacillus cycloheptanicus TaxID=1457 RepID=A0ABT9XGU1_9BACL|nr:hypothetical protein [Alicyclobacillus cycloheptanicus]MDQ0189259.1 hypothetical protein [Alicyclobacillus cycloheptanicus]WDM00442.1 hypothetical protein JI721_12000 [Alicyclobacillus cycloheptanicus]